MQIMYINCDGAGFADHVEVNDGLTVGTFFEQQMPERRPEDYLIRINRQHATRDQQLQEGDRVSVTPVKIEGAVPGYVV